MKYYPFVCKYPDKECAKENWFIRHGYKGGDKRMCRLPELKRKKSVCPYNPVIRSKSRAIYDKNVEGIKKLESFERG